VSPDTGTGTGERLLKCIEVVAQWWNTCLHPKVGGSNPSPVAGDVERLPKSFELINTVVEHLPFSTRGQGFKSRLSHWYLQTDCKEVFSR